MSAAVGDSTIPWQRGAEQRRGPACVRAPLSLSLPRGEARVHGQGVIHSSRFSSVARVSAHARSGTSCEGGARSRARRRAAAAVRAGIRPSFLGFALWNTHPLTDNKLLVRCQSRLVQSHPAARLPVRPTPRHRAADEAHDNGDVKRGEARRGQAHSATESRAANSAQGNGHTQSRRGLGWVQAHRQAGRRGEADAMRSLRQHESESLEHRC